MTTKNLIEELTLQESLLFDELIEAARESGSTNGVIIEGGK